MSKYLKINKLSYTYPDGHQALKEISFSIEKGESVAILGPNGAGKTTLILHLNGILGKLTGEIEVDGLEYSTENIAKIRKTVGVVFQDPDDQLFMPTVLEDVMFGPKNFGYSDEESEKNAIEALKMVGMDNFQDRAPHHLSFGQKRKVAIATVLASKPKLLVLDEPASNLDPASRRDLIKILMNLNISIILVTHDLPMALEICDRSLVLNEGMIKEDSLTKNILKNEELMKENRLELPYGFALHHLGEE
ncbi:MAG: ABC transporter ATP-binding protein [Actinomycetota bacterium]|nr:ABC transporter ATP-binding protein [Actinomycetota bacterium]|tara:strand:+ start:2082 stop:2828 length:747 start_codon:yes stop_codon:yes gene_type:complete